MASKPQAGSTFVIATRNRPEELVRTITSLVDQTVLPMELCIVDSSEEATARDVIEKLCADVGLKLDYHHPAPRGLTIQRNIGIDRTTGDPVFLIDDDVDLRPDCHEECLKEYDRWGSDLGGVAANPVHPARPPKLSIWWRRLFGCGGWWPEASGKVRAGFWVEGVSESKSVKRVEACLGYFMSFRRKVFEYERFDEALAGYADKEDIDFTYRVSRRFALVQTPHARCHHFKTETSRMPEAHVQRMKLANHRYLHKKNMPQDLRHRAAVWWGLAGLFFLNVGQTLVKGQRGLMSGMVVGVWEQLFARKGLVDPAAPERDRAQR